MLAQVLRLSVRTMIWDESGVAAEPVPASAPVAGAAERRRQRANTAAGRSDANMPNENPNPA